MYILIFIIANPWSDINCIPHVHMLLVKWLEQISFYMLGIFSPTEKSFLCLMISYYDLN